ncbi:MAG: hypothetical protein R3A46_15030 [Thermomicrobiales bacterium]
MLTDPEHEEYPEPVEQHREYLYELLDRRAGLLASRNRPDEHDLAELAQIEDILASYRIDVEREADEGTDTRAVNPIDGDDSRALEATSSGGVGAGQQHHQSAPPPGPGHRPHRPDPQRPLASIDRAGDGRRVAAIALADLPGIQHLLGDDAEVLAAARNRWNETLVLVDTGGHREGTGRYVTWMLGLNNCCLLGHYFNNQHDAVRDLHRRSFGFDPTLIKEEE